MLGTVCRFTFPAQGLGVSMYAAAPTLRLALSFASLWGVISFSIAGISFPVMAMHPVLQGLSLLFPLRHYIVIYQINIFDGFPLQYTSWNFAALLFFILLPVLSAGRIKKNMLQSVYIP